MVDLAARLLRSRTALIVGVLLGIGVRVALVVLYVPLIQTEWFEPFFADWIAHPSVDPWTTYLGGGGDPQAFPYGPVMLVVFGVGALIGSALPVPFGIQLGIAIVLLAVESAVWILALAWTPSHRNRTLLLLALNPVLIYATFVHGQLDLLPTALMFGSLWFVRSQRWFASGLLIGLAIAAKFSAVLVAPLILIFLIRNARFRRGWRPFLIGMVPGIVLTLLPALFSEGYRTMVIMTPTAQSVISYSANLGPGLTIVILPIVFAVILAVQYRFKRGNPDLVVLITGIALTSVVLLTPASPGWYVWSVPFLVVCIVSLSRRVAAVTGLFWVVATVTLSLRASGAVWRFSGTGGDRGTFIEVGSFIHEIGAFGAILSTATVVTGVAATVLIFLRGRIQLDSYRLSEAPLGVAIAGDSGTGKDTLCVSLTDVFGSAATTFVQGDDYHLYDRRAPLWSITTHLHPGANDLAAMSEDAVALMAGNRIRRKHYDHSRGLFTKPVWVEPRELVVVNGLHSLASRDIRDRADLSVFMEMEERLRRRLKIERDVQERGGSLASVIASVERRYEHTSQFVTPQAALADIIVRVESVSALPPEDEPLVAPPQLRLVVTLQDAPFAATLQRLLVSLAQCPTHIKYLDTPGTVQLIIYPDDVTRDDVAGVARSLVTRPQELFLSAPRWHEQSVGVIQLVVVIALLERRKRRENKVA